MTPVIEPSCGLLTMTPREIRERSTRAPRASSDTLLDCGALIRHLPSHSICTTRRASPVPHLLLRTLVFCPCSTRSIRSSSCLASSPMTLDLTHSVGRAHVRLLFSSCVRSKERPQIFLLRGGAYFDRWEMCASCSRDLLRAVCLDTRFLLIRL
jgi:hypothetical protein